MLVALPSKSVCCARPADAPSAAPKSAPVAVKTSGAPRDYKESGSPSAPLACEIYTDFECPACAAFYRDTYPQLEAQYVKTGKVRILHRDFPLPQHPFAQLAAHYADAAGELGQYELVFNRLFETQAEWSANGNIEAALKPALSPEMLAKIRDSLANPKLDRSIALDRAQAIADRLNQTPTLIVVTPDGVRHKLAGAQPFGILSAYLDELAGTRR